MAAYYGNFFQVVVLTPVTRSKRRQARSLVVKHRSPAFGEWAASHQIFLMAHLGAPPQASFITSVVGRGLPASWTQQPYDLLFCGSIRQYFCKTVDDG